MFGKVKFRLLSSIATLAIFVGVLGIKPACIFFSYQPEVPAHLRDN